MDIIKKTPDNGMHPAVPELQESLRKGKISRREFLRFAGLLGLSVGTASVLANCAPAATPTEAPPQLRQQQPQFPQLPLHQPLPVAVNWYVRAV